MCCNGVILANKKKYLNDNAKRNELEQAAETLASESKYSEQAAL